MTVACCLVALALPSERRLIDAHSKCVFDVWWRQVRVTVTCRLGSLALPLNRRIAVLLAEDPLAREDPRDPTSRCVCKRVRECVRECVGESVGVCICV